MEDNLKDTKEETIKTESTSDLKSEAPDSPVKNKKKKMKINKTMLLVAGLVVLTGILLIVSIQSKIKLPLNKDLGTNVVEETDFAHSSLSVSEEPRSSTNGGNEVDINIDSGDNKATGVQIEATYDPAVLTNVDIKPGTFFENPVEIQKIINEETGRITFLIGNEVGKEGVMGTGPIAIISFTKVGSGETTIDLLPESLVTAEGYDSSVLKETSSAVIGELSPNPSQ